MPAPGLDKMLCNAQRPNQPKGVLCKRVAGHGTDHLGVGRCSRHGGSTETHAKHAEVEIARRACETLGIPIEVDPREALERELWECSGNVAFYRELVQALPTHPGDDELVIDEEGRRWQRGDPGIYGRTYHQSGIPTGEAKPHVLVVLYNQERDRLRAVAVEAAKAGVEERRVTLAEEQGQKVAAVIRGVLIELGTLLGTALFDRPETPGIVRKHLMLVAGQ